MAKAADPGIRVDDHMAEATRKILHAQFEVMAANEAGSRLGDDIEHVHNMRVATRRMRAAFDQFEGYFQRKAIKRFRKDLRKTGQTLGAVRDLDVFNREAQRYLKGLEKAQRDSLDPLLAHWQTQREEARQVLIAYLDSERYRRFVDEFGKFLQAAGAGVEPVAADEVGRYQVRHALSSTIWQLYETVRAYETVLADAPMTTLHALRIDCKQLRYTLEFFREVLGPETGQVIKDIVHIQDHLGDLQDAVVAQILLGDLLADWRRQGKKDDGLSGADIQGVEAYLAYRREEAERLIRTFPQEWPLLNSQDFRERLAATLEVL